jgi:hypothetical protein
LTTTKHNKTRVVKGFVDYATKQTNFVAHNRVQLPPMHASQTQRGLRDGFKLHYITRQTGRTAGETTFKHMFAPIPLFLQRQTNKVHNQTRILFHRINADDTQEETKDFDYKTARHVADFNALQFVPTKGGIVISL